MANRLFLLPFLLLLFACDQPAPTAEPVQLALSPQPTPTQPPVTLVSTVRAETATPVAQLVVTVEQTVATLTPQPTMTEAVAAWPTCETVSDISATECAALLALFESADGVNWGGRYPSGQMRWFASDHACRWFGVTCDSGRVTKLDLSDSGLSGVLPDAIGELSTLDTLSLHHNQLSGPLPEGLLRLSSLHSADLSNNQLGGTLPQDWTRLIQLEALNLNYNQFEGSIPDTLAELPQLNWLDVSHNHLSGELPTGFLELAYFNFVQTQLLVLPSSTAAAVQIATPTPVVIQSTISLPVPVVATLTPAPTAEASGSSQIVSVQVAIVPAAAGEPSPSHRVNVTWDVRDADRVIIIWNRPYQLFQDVPNVFYRDDLNGSVQIRPIFAPQRNELIIEAWRGEDVTRYSQQVDLPCQGDYFFDDAQVFQRHAIPVGCPQWQLPTTFTARSQAFENGLMLAMVDSYLGQTPGASSGRVDPVLAFVTANDVPAPYAGRYWVLHDTYLGDYPEPLPTLTPEAAGHMPVGPFGGYWSEIDWLRDQIGWATGPLLEAETQQQKEADGFPPGMHNAHFFIRLPDGRLLAAKRGDVDGANYWLIVEP